MADVRDYGPRLSEADYEKQVSGLYLGLPPVLSHDQERALHRRQFELAIDYRLGCGYPQQRRDALWEIQQRVDKKRLWLAPVYLIKSILPGTFERKAHGLAGFMVKEYAKVLNQEELNQFFDLKAGDTPELPFDRR